MRTGIHPIRIADGFDKACKIAVAHLDEIADTVEFSLDDRTNLLKAARTSLGSKMYVDFLFISISSALFPLSRC